MVSEPPARQGNTGRNGLDWPGRREGITDRESEILALITQGKSNAEVAALTYLSPNTVKSYIRSVYRKINADSPHPSRPLGRETTASRPTTTGSTTGAADPEMPHHATVRPRQPESRQDPQNKDGVILCSPARYRCAVICLAPLFGSLAATRHLRLLSVSAGIWAPV